MKDNSTNSESSKEINKKKPGKNDSKDEFLEQWKDGSHKNMGNDIESEIKIANSKGANEGGTDKRWHMDEEQ